MFVALGAPAIVTPLLERGHAAGLPEVLGQAQPWPECGRPEHIADAALFLASDDSLFVTGEALVIDGGLTARGPGVFARDNPAGKAIANSISRGLSGRREGQTGTIRFDPGTSD